MGFDPQNAPSRKDEYESARLAEAEWTEQIHALKTLAARCGVHPVALCDRLGAQGLAAALTMLARQTGQAETVVETRFLRVLAAAHAQQRARRDGPAPVAHA